MSDDQRKLTAKWEQDTKRIYRAHYESAVRAQDLNKYLALLC